MRTALFVADAVIDQLRDHAAMWKRDELSAIRDGETLRAMQARHKAAALDAEAEAFERQKLELSET